ncbi:class A beta-lactamase [Cysteiniphilum sp. JM-1]|uniref:class A beta-lactamase n=1 Tax=Cysteiniphilum sp. JM-1 TaxID=2610891 RepID=UPI00124881FF|nr:class A beta-lactamase [Cysteiniphilum sp. JM-1]
MRLISKYTVGVTLSLLTLTSFANVNNNFKALEKQYGGQLAISAIDTSNDQVVDYHANKRMPMCSTFKLMLVAAVLNKSVNEPKLLEKKIEYTQKDMVNAYSPYTKENLGKGMTVSALCHAAMLSDNTAANLLLKELGGLDKLNQFARSIGDTTFRLDRYEPYLNTAIPGDKRDTTTAKAMSQSLDKIVLGNVLPAMQRDLLIKWMQTNTTGDKRIKAGVNKSWIVGDKTGTGDYGTTNDIGVIWPNKCKPIVISVFYTQDKQDAKAQDVVIQKATSFAVAELGKTNFCLEQIAE